MLNSEKKSIQTIPLRWHSNHLHGIKWCAVIKSVWNEQETNSALFFLVVFVWLYSTTLRALLITITFFYEVNSPIVTFQEFKWKSWKMGFFLLHVFGRVFSKVKNDLKLDIRFFFRPVANALITWKTMAYDVLHLNDLLCSFKWR